MADYYNYVYGMTSAQSPAAFQSPVMAYQRYQKQSQQTSTPVMMHQGFQVPMSPMMGGAPQPWMMSPQFPYHYQVHATSSPQLTRVHPHMKFSSPRGDDSGLGASIVQTPVSTPSRKRARLSTQSTLESPAQPEPARPAVPSTPYSDLIDLVKTASAITPEPAKPIVTPPVERVVKKAKRRCPTKIVDNKIVAKNKPLDSFAVNVMNTWYLQHVDHPYPSDEDKEQLALDGNISVIQVKSWFSNKRNRSHNTKPRNEKRKLEDQIVQFCQDLMQPEKRQTTSIDSVVEQLLSLVETNRQ
ncbi:uncharacterized protein LOC135500211 [Lineus longissimus]|uniref:uncharacterized protein LOC135500211 n=1 Tax=Lineus longissimus TaxID=88925 RepID=UPI00315D11A9